ncbi:MAG: PDZ domain-containing protein, partial [Chloroflexi bacterium]|nr:PDZ domain-containing protein [Chloroflexota bacterium]
MSRWTKLSLLLVALTGLACSTVMTALSGTPTPQPSPTLTATPSATFSPSPSPSATIAPTPTAFPTLTLAPTFTPPAISATPDAAAQKRRLRVFQQLWDAVNTHYVYPDFNEHDWKAIGDKYRAMIAAGQSDEEFYRAMDDMVAELGDEHSSFEAPADVADTNNAMAGENTYGGIGVLVTGHPKKGYVSIIVTFEDGPARAAGLRPHDRILAVDGLSLVDANGDLHSELMRGEPGSSLTLTIQSPDGSAPRDVRLTRAEINGAVPIDYWLVPGTHIAYLLIPT